MSFYPDSVESPSEVTRSIDAVERSLQAIDRREAQLHAWTYLDRDGAQAAARQATTGALVGLTAGVKDIFDTADLPTEYGSAIYEGYRPRADAGAVSLVRSAGAIVMGKTVTAELAWSTPGATRNPLRESHTPGGSSSGSAAAVAAGMVDFALGTQTAGSVIRPASFCGIYGFKPTFGLIPTSGMKQGAPSLDTVGILAANLDTINLVRLALSRRTAREVTDRLNVGFLRTEMWQEADADCRAALEHAAALLGASEVNLAERFIGLADDCQVVQAYEGARTLAWERSIHPDMLSLELRRRLEWGDEIAQETYDEVRRRIAVSHSQRALDELFSGADVLVTAAAVGEAPEGLASTGDPKFCRLWTALGFPALTVPGLVGASGLPIGIQLVARPFDDDRLIAAGKHLSEVLS